MKKIVALVLAMALMLALCACGANSNGEKAKKISLTKMASTGVISYNNLKLDGMYYTNESGSLRIPFKYNSRNGYADQNGNIIIENVSSSYQTNFVEGFAFAGSSVINDKGEVVFTLPKGVEESYFKDGKAVMIKKVAKLNSGLPYTPSTISAVCTLDKNMSYQEKLIEMPDEAGPLEASWCTVNDGFCGLLGIYYTKDGLKIAIVNTEGKIVTMFDLQKTESAVNSAFSIVNVSRWISSASLGTGDADLTKIIFVKNGYANVMNEEGKWGLMNLNDGSMVLDYKYDYVGAYSNGVVPVCNYGTWGVVDMDGTEVIPCQSYKYIGAFVNGRALAVTADENVGVIDKKGNLISTYDISLDMETSRGSIKKMFYTDFTEETQIACIYLHKKAYIVSANGDVLLSTTPLGAYNLDRFLYMNNDYIAIGNNYDIEIYKIEK